AAWHFPEIFGRVLSQSGSFVSIEKGHTFPDLVRAAERKNIRGYMSVSSNDNEARQWGSWVDANHLLWGALRQKKYDFVYSEDEGFHNWYTWELQLPDALAALWK
ncbi:MAG: esterase family protein, partial [Bryobacteraceae bacterium]